MHIICQKSPLSKGTSLCLELMHMVKSPQDLGRSTKGDLKKAIHLEKKIDDFLDENYGLLGKSITLSIDLFAGYSPKIRDYVLDTYRKAGWNVEYFGFCRERDDINYIFSHKSREE